MSRAGTAWRHLRRGDREAIIRVLSRSFMPSWLFRTNVLVFARLDAVKRLPRALPRINIRPGGPEDEPILQQIRPREEGYRHHFERGALLFIGEVDGEPASFNWFDLMRHHVSFSNAYTVDIGEHAAWAFGFETLPRFRMSGVFHKHWFETQRLLAERGVGPIFGAIQGDNPASLNAHRRLGFSVLCRYRVFRCLGMIVHAIAHDDVENEPRQLRFGRAEIDLTAETVSLPQLGAPVTR